MTEREALKALIHEMEYVLSCINAEEIPFDGDDFHEALRLGKEALDHLAQPAVSETHEQRSVSDVEPVAWATRMGEYAHIHWGAKRPEYPMVYEVPLYTTPPTQCKHCLQRSKDEL